MTTDWAGLFAALVKADPDAEHLIDHIEEVSIEMLLRERRTTRSPLPPIDDATTAVLRRWLERPPSDP